MNSCYFSDLSNTFTKKLALTNRDLSWKVICFKVLVLPPVAIKDNLHNPDQVRICLWKPKLTFQETLYDFKFEDDDVQNWESLFNQRYLPANSSYTNNFSNFILSEFLNDEMISICI